MWFKVAIVAIVVITFFSFAYTIPEGYRGVLITFGKVSGIVDPGLHVKFPFVQRVKRFEVRTQKYETDAQSASSDLQQVKTTIAVQYFVNPEEVDNLYGQYGMEYRKRIIYPAVQEVVKSSTAKFTASELITKREEVKELIVSGMTDRMDKVDINVQNIDITDFQFSEAFSQAIEEKVKAEQDALKEKNRLERVKFEAQQKIETAMGEAERIRLESTALRNSPELLEKMRVEVFKEVWDGRLPVIIIGGGTGGGSGTVIPIPMDITRLMNDGHKPIAE